MFTPDEMPQPKPRGGMFGGGKAPEVIMAALAGLMARRNPQLAQAVMGMMHQKQQQALEEQQYQRKREDGRDDFVFENQWKADHAQPDFGEFERALMASGVQPGTPQWTDAMKRRANNMLDPIVNTIQGPVLRSMVTGGMGAPPQPVGSLTPIDDEGGAGSPAPRPFPY